MLLFVVQHVRKMLENHSQQSTTCQKGKASNRKKKKDQSKQKQNSTMVSSAAVFGIVAVIGAVSGILIGLVGIGGIVASLEQAATLRRAELRAEQRRSSHLRLQAAFEELDASLNRQKPHVGQVGVSSALLQNLLVQQQQ